MRLVGRRVGDVRVLRLIRAWLKAGVMEEGNVTHPDRGWLRRKHQRSWRSARKRWNYRFLYKRCRLYQMGGRVSHLPGLRRTPPDEDGRRAGCGKSACPVR